MKSEICELGKAERHMCLKLQTLAMEIGKHLTYRRAVTAVEHDFKTNKIWIDIEGVALMHHYEIAADGKRFISRKRNATLLMIRGWLG